MQGVDPALRKNGGAVFSVLDDAGDETLVVVQEVERVHRHSIDVADMVGRVREAVANEHEVFARHVVLIRPGTLPKTTSGKIQRGVARRLWLDNKLELLTADVLRRLRSPPGCGSDRPRTRCARPGMHVLNRLTVERDDWPAA